MSRTDRHTSAGAHQPVAPPGASGPTTLFIGGLGRSGTTILELSLATDPRVVSLGEVTHLWRRSLLDNETCGCGEGFRTCPFWTEVGQRAFGGWGAVDPARVIDLKRRLDRSIQTPRLGLGLLSGTTKAEVSEYASYYSRIYRAAAEVTGAEVVIDSSKQASLPHLLHADRELDLRVLHCVRDSRAVAYSWTKTVTRPESQTGRHATMVRYPPPMTAAKWLQHNLVVEGLRPRGVPVLRVRYEDWAREPRTEVTRALAFAGLDEQPNERVGEDYVDLGQAHTCSGNPARFKHGVITIRSDERWRSQLPQRTQRLVAGVTLPLLAAYGYLGRRT